MRLALASTTLVLAALLAADAGATDLSEITAQDYYGAAYFKEAREHPKLAQKSRPRQLALVARDLRWKIKRLKSAIRKVDALDGDPIEMARSALEKGFAASRVNGHVLDVLINAEEPKHVVVYVRWQASTRKDVVKEASSIAHVVAKEAPLISTLSLSAIHPKAAPTSRTSVWSAKIGRDAMGRIQEKRIDDYADRLYAGLFEGVETKPF